MKPYITITFPKSGYEYLVSSSAIVAMRAKARADLSGESVAEAQAAVETAFADESILRSWVKTLHWSDLEPHAALVRLHPRSHQAEMPAAEVCAVNERPAAVPLTGDNIMDLPMMVVLQSMLAEGSECSVTAINQDSPVSAAIIVVQGQTEVVQGYIATVSEFNRFMSTQRANAAIADPNTANSTTH